MRRNARTLALVLAALPLACGRSEGLAEHPRLEPLQLRRIAGQESPRKPVVVFSLHVPEESRRWGESVEAPARLPGEGRTEVRVWKGGGQLFIPDPPDLSSVNQLWVHGRFTGSHKVRLRLGEGEGALVRESTVESHTGPAPLRLDLPGKDQDRDREWSSLDLMVQGPDCEIERFELVTWPIEAALPGPEHPRLLRVGESYRRSAVVAPGRGLEASFDVGPGDVLEFALGIPAAVRADLGKSALVVTIEAHPEQERHEFPLAPLRGSPRGWSLQTLPLGRFAGLRVHVRFEIPAPMGRQIAAALASPWVGHRGRRAPKVVLITSDTHRGDHVGAASDSVGIRTPAIDALAERGVMFEDCFSTSHITCPSHAAILTGLPPRDTGIVANGVQRLSPEALTLAEAFRSAGFRTLAVVSNQLLGPESADVTQGFDRLMAPRDDIWRAEVPVAIAQDWLADAEGLPTFLWLHVFDAHFPYEPPGEFDRAYYAPDKDPFDLGLPDPGLGPPLLPPALEGLRDLDFPGAQYRGEISYLDAQLGRLLDSPRLDDAIVAFTADHGEVLVRADDLFDHKLLLPDTLHVPLVLAWPAAPAGARVPRAVDHLALGRTLLDLAGLEAAPFPGQSLLAALEPGSSAARPRYAIGDYGCYASVTTDEWFLVLYLKDVKRKGVQYYKHQLVLYDRRNDPLCTENVARQQTEAVRALKRLLVDWLCSSGEQLRSGAHEASEEQIALLRSLGYIGTPADPAPEEWVDPDCACERCAELR